MSLSVAMLICEVWTSHPYCRDLSAHGELSREMHCAGSAYEQLVLHVGEKPTHTFTHFSENLSFE